MGIEDVTARISAVQARMGDIQNLATPQGSAVSGINTAAFEDALAIAQAGTSPDTLDPMQSPLLATAAFAPAPRPAALSAAAPDATSSGALSDTQLRDVLAEAGFQGDALRTAWALARRESGGRPGAESAPNSNGTQDHGLFQINDIHRGSWIDFTRLADPLYNAQVAFRMSDGGRNFSSWALGDSGWAGHLQQSNPQAYAQMNARFQQYYQSYPF
ncbi:MAG: hypothetical protein WC005_05780 [Candidatus Nanopelagicales bacterium]